MKIKQMLSKKVTIAGKTIPAFLVVSILSVGLGSAALLTYYGRITTTVNVQQSVLVDGKVGEANIQHITQTVVAGEEVCFLHKIENQASVPIGVEFSNTLYPDDGGITTSLYAEGEKTQLKLTSKDSTWTATYTMTATLTFDPVSPTFDYTLTAIGLTAGEKYALIYYGDKAPRFSVWGGDNPGAVIDTFTATTGTTSVSGSSEINMNLPSLLDWNINPVPDYCNKHNTYDEYEHCKGAKIWIVKTSDLTPNGAGHELPLISWNPTAWLFETDLITYSDCDLPAGPDFPFYMDKGTDITNSGLTIPAETTVPVLLCYKSNNMAYGDGYTITTTVVPYTGP